MIYYDTLQQIYLEYKQYRTFQSDSCNTVNGSVYGGGYRDNGNTLIKGDTNITLSGGTVTGNVYAGGQDDIINGNTNVTVLGAGTQVAGTVSGGGDNSTIAGDRNLKIGTNDIAATCSFSIKDFDNLIIAAGSEATLEFADTDSQMTLDNLALLVDSDNESATLTLNNISFDSFTLMIELTDEQMAPFLDGRILTALQAKELGLIDDVLFFDEAMERIFADLGGEIAVKDITPETQLGFEDMFTSEILKWIMP